MADLPSGMEEKEVTRVGSPKTAQSPGRAFSKSRSSSSNPFRRLLPFGRKSSGKSGSDNSERHADYYEMTEVEESPNLVEPAAHEVIHTIQEVIHETIETHDVQQQGNANNPPAEPKESSSGTDEKKPDTLGKLMEEGIEKIKEDLQDKAQEGQKEELKGIVQKDKAPSNDDHQPLKEKEALEKSNVNIDDEAQERTCEEEKEGKKVVLKEDDCLSSLAEGLQKLCAPWNSKKDD